MQNIIPYDSDPWKNSLIGSTSETNVTRHNNLALSLPLQEIFSNGTRKCVGYPWYMAVMNQWWNLRIKARTRECNFPQCATWKLLKGNKCMWQNKKEARYYSLDETSSVDTITLHDLLSFTFLQPRNVNQWAPFRQVLCALHKYSATYKLPHYYTSCSRF